MRNLRGEFVDVKGRNQTNDAFGNAFGDRRQIWLGELRQVCKTIDSPRELFEFPIISKLVERAGWIPAASASRVRTVPPISRMRCLASSIAVFMAWLPDNFASIS
jgi:hypothetical protein